LFHLHFREYPDISCSHEIILESNLFFGLLS